MKANPNSVKRKTKAKLKEKLQEEAAFNAEALLHSAGVARKVAQFLHE